MMINAITFEIRDFTTGNSEEFVVENNELNYDMIASHRYTRGIQFIDMFDFEFERKEHTPKFILFGEAVGMAFVENLGVADLDSIDEMVGVYA